MDPYRLAVALALAVLSACGYRPLYGGEGPARGESFGVVGAPPLVADGAVVSEVEAGVRSGLARAGRLASGDAYPRVVVEVVRIDNESEGIAAVAGTPLARGTRVGITARAWIERSAGADHERDTGDLRAVDVMAVEGDARLEALRWADASRASARRLGGRLARALLGEPVAADDGM